jgi:hypothetical protein
MIRDESHRGWTGGTLGLVFLLAALFVPGTAHAATLAQFAYAKPSNTGAADAFGTSVAVSGDTVVVGAPTEDSLPGDPSDNSAPQSGAAYVFARTGNTWTQQAYLKASNAEAGDRFGLSVAISGDTIVVGAPVESSNATGVNHNQVSNSASASGAAYVFTRTGNTWTQQAYLKASNTGVSDNFGTSVAISGDTAVVGASGEGSNATGVNGNQADNSAGGSGAAYVFERSGGIWTQHAYLKAAIPGNGGGFGRSVGASGDTVVVGTDLADAAYVFFRSGGSWAPQASLAASNLEVGDLFGQSVGISGDTIVVGARAEDSNATGINGNETDNSANASGAAYVFGRAGGTWTQQAYVKASNTGNSDSFGTSVAISGDAIVIGANGEASNATGVNGNQADDSASASGALYVFKGSGAAWTQQAYVKASNTGAGDWFGAAVAVSGDTMVAGAQQEDSSAVGLNGNQADNSAAESGAAYILGFDDDGDGAPNSSDNCPATANTSQENYDGDAFGNVCDADDDNDAVADGSDACPLGATGPGDDADGDGCKSAEDADDDGDGAGDAGDNCPTTANGGQENRDADSTGDACDDDDDNDGLLDASDSCPVGATGPGDDIDGDGCKSGEDSDDDGDGAADSADDCPAVATADQADNDHDGAGDACDSDDDNDGVADGADNCRLDQNPGQEIRDGDARGDACDPVDDRPAEVHCIVPSVPRGSSKAATASALTKANCTLGKVTKKPSTKVKKGKLIKLKTPAGTELADGAAVNAVFSSGPRKH